MTIDKIKTQVITFIKELRMAGAAPEDTLTAVDLLISSSLEAVPREKRIAVAAIFSETIKEKLRG